MSPAAADRSAIGFKRHLAVTVVPGAGTCLVSPRGVVTVAGEGMELLAPLLDGTRTLDRIREDLAGNLPPGRVDRLVQALDDAGLIGTRPASGTPAAAYWELAGGREPEASSRTGVLVLPSAAGLDAGDARAALHAAGLAGAFLEVPAAPSGADRPEPPPAFRVILCGDYLDPALDDVNSRALDDGVPWLLARVTGPDLWIGPVFRPGEGPCWECLAVRLRGHRHEELQLRAVHPGLEAPQAWLPCTHDLGLRLVALEGLKWQAGIRSPYQDSVSTLDTVGLATTRHPVTRRPQCGRCGEPGLAARAAGRPVRLAPRPASTGNGTSHRAVPPERTWERFRHLCDPVTGIASRVERDPHCPEWLHAYLSGANLAMAPGEGGLRQHSGGKGTTALEAKVGALCEAVERYCGTRSGDEPVVRDTAEGLGGQAVPANDVQLFHPEQFASRERWNATALPFHRVPEPVPPTEPIDWTPVWSLTRSRQRFLPNDLLYFGGRGHRGLRADSNGNAAGSSPEDAVLQGLLELLERDAVALWWYNRTRQPAVDLDSFDDPWIARLRARYAGLGRTFWVLDVTSDLGVPVMVAVSRRVGAPTEDLMFGFGAHLDPAVAARRALAELGQLLPAALAPPGRSGAVEGWIRQWWDRATVAGQPYLAPAPDVAARTAADYRHVPGRDLLEDVEGLVRVLARQDLEVLVLDQTRPDVGLPVVKVVVPGLRHFWPRLAPGRLYDVPVRLGRLPEPARYESLNPVPLFL